MDTEIKIQINDKIKILNEKETKIFLEQQKKDKIEKDKIEAEMQAKQATLDSAIAKLAKLGLTEDEAKAIVGIQ